MELQYVTVYERLGRTHGCPAPFAPHKLLGKQEGQISVEMRKQTGSVTYPRSNSN